MTAAANQAESEDIIETALAGAAAVAATGNLIINNQGQRQRVFDFPGNLREISAGVTIYPSETNGSLASRVPGQR